MSSPSPLRTVERTGAKLSEPTPHQISHDRHDRYEPSTPTQFHQRQSRTTLAPQQPSSPSRSLASTLGRQSSTSSQHRLRRTPRFSASPSPQPPRTPEPPSRAPVTPDPEGRPGTRSKPRQLARKLSQDLSSDDDEEDEDDDAPLPNHPLRPGFNAPEPGPLPHISKRTHRAILYTLEELLRGPYPLSPDLVEETASMADLLGGSGVATSNGNVSPTPRMPAARTPAGSPSGIRGPRMIMQERAAREARQREERERLEREHAAEEARALEEANRREKERRAAAAHVAATGPGGTTTGSAPPGLDPAIARRPATSSGPRMAAPGPARPATSGQAQPSQHQGALPPQASQIPMDDEIADAAGPSGTQNMPASDALGASGRGRNSFPHAFERWETLSAHWEGLTSFWIRKLKQNAEEINNDPISQHLARNVTDLSSAGANLFHAVVELQRLRASSERKFQRWFFETRQELERNREVTAMLEVAIEEERRSREQAIQEALEREQGNSRIQKQLSEMRKELQISKEEARRAWEELGRREQEERERTVSLQSGHPTIVGGVQVVPMTQGVSRHSSQRDPHGYGAGEPEYGHAPSSRNDYAQAPAVQPVPTSSSGGASSAVHHQVSYGSEGTYSEGENARRARGGSARDSRGATRPPRPSVSNSVSDGGLEEYETPGAQPASYPTTSGGQQQYSAAPDYSGTGYSPSGWETMGSARHHHPTRLSDVLEEEEERSRTSASQSQVSRG